jgi:hypothetical protein
LLPDDFLVAGVMPKSFKSVKRRQIFDASKPGFGNGKSWLIAHLAV